ncbi:c-type cytochrome [Methylobacterium sp. CM6246]
MRGPSRIGVVRGLALPLGALLAGAALAAPQSTVPQSAVPERLAPCVACHGSGTSETEGVPSLGGQQADYVVTQLFQFREKQREAPPMNDVAAGFSDDDLRAYADAVATLPPPAWSGPAADPALVARAQALVSKHQCNSCHGADLAGRDAIPRIRAQREEVLAQALSAYKSNARPGYDPAMNEVAQGLGEADIKDLAAYVARF